MDHMNEHAIETDGLKAALAAAHGIMDGLRDREQLVGLGMPDLQGVVLERQAAALIAALNRLAAHGEAAMRALDHAVCQTLGRALGYPSLAELGGHDELAVCVDEHDAISLAEEASRYMAMLRTRAERAESFNKSAELNRKSEDF